MALRSLNDPRHAILPDGVLLQPGRLRSTNMSVECSRGHLTPGDTATGGDAVWHGASGRRNTACSATSSAAATERAAPNATAASPQLEPLADFLLPRRGDPREAVGERLRPVRHRARRGLPGEPSRSRATTHARSLDAQARHGRRVRGAAPNAREAAKLDDQRVVHALQQRVVQCDVGEEARALIRHSDAIPQRGLGLPGAAESRRATRGAGAVFGCFAALSAALPTGGEG